jgi:hypothetical protein
MIQNLEEQPQSFKIRPVFRDQLLEDLYNEYEITKVELKIVSNLIIIENSLFFIIGCTHTNRFLFKLNPLTQKLIRVVQIPVIQY